MPQTYFRVKLPCSQCRKVLTADVWFSLTTKILLVVYCDDCDAMTAEKTTARAVTKSCREQEAAEAAANDLKTMPVTIPPQ